MKSDKAGVPGPIELHEPVFETGGTLYAALKRRRTSREIGEEPLGLQVLSEILWAAQGINRESGPFGDPGRTAGSASNSREIYIYVAMEEGTYIYEPGPHRLTPVAGGDTRALAIGRAQQPSGARAPVRLVYVVDLERFESAGFDEPGLHDPEIQKSYYYVDTGLIAQNVYLACASLGLESWFHNCDREALTKALGLEPHRLPLFGQTIGYARD
jgi:SagB-type dehydrogenase family enzyme